MHPARKNSPRAVPAPTVTKHAPRPADPSVHHRRGHRGVHAGANDHFQASRKNSPRAVPAPTVTKHAPRTVVAPPARTSLIDSLRSWFADRFEGGRELL
jgi:hypothetical protein